MHRKGAEFLESAISLAKVGGRALKRHWGKLKQIESKGTSIDLVTDADRASEKSMIRYLKKNHPSHAILSEESGLSDSFNAEYLWVIDPLDGTTNFTHQYPVVSVSVALLYKGTPIVGVVLNPIIKELFHAARGHGSYFNKSRIQVSKTTTLESSLLASGFPYDRQTTKDNNYSEFCFLTHVSQGVRRAGSAAIDLAYVAAGRFDGYWEKGIKPWDIAAGVLLVEEAGGRVTDYSQDPFQLESGRIIASNGLIHAQLSDKIDQARAILSKS